VSGREKSREPDSHLEIVEQVLADETLVGPYKRLVLKAEQLDVEFLRDCWPDYDADSESLENVFSGVHRIDPTLTRTEIVSILARVRVRLKF
jgi:hypothetical protein